MILMGILAALFRRQFAHTTMVGFYCFRPNDSEVRLAELTFLLVGLIAIAFGTAGLVWG